MKHLDAILISARSNKEQVNERFVKQTIHAVQTVQGRTAFARLMNMPHSVEKKSLLAKIVALPKFVLAACGVIALTITSGGVYAAVNWFSTNVSTRQEGNMVYSLADQCPPSQPQALQQHQAARINTAQYKILKPELITEHDLQLNELSTCEQRAIEGSLRAIMPKVYRPGDSHNGLYYPVATYGKIASINAHEVKLSHVPLGHTTAAREVATVTIKLQDNSLIMDKGTTIDLASLKKGDSVYFIFQNPVRSGQNDNEWRSTPSTQSIVRALAVTQYDMVGIGEKMFKAASENAYQIIYKSDAYGG